MQNKEVIAEIRRLEKESGTINPIDVVDAAREENSPMHPYFEWDDSEAAQQYRLVQARNLIRVCVEYIATGDEETVLVQAFVSLSTDRTADGGYRTMQSVMVMETLYAQLLEDARQEMERFKLKYSRLKELVSVLAAMDKALSKVDHPEAKAKRKRKPKPTDVATSPKVTTAPGESPSASA
jgi:hypothetical protein